jgi:hypothetical protein
MNLVRHKEKPKVKPIQEEPKKTMVEQNNDQNTAGNPNFIASSDNSILITSIIETLMGPKTTPADPVNQSEKVAEPLKSARSNSVREQIQPALGKLISDKIATNKKDPGTKSPAGQKQAENPVTEPLGVIGLVLAILGFIPIIGLLFSTLAIIFGAISLSKISRNPGKYKNKGIATASIIIGALSFIVGIIILVSSVNAAEDSVNTGCQNASTTRCRV